MQGSKFTTALMASAVVALHICLNILDDLHGNKTLWLPYLVCLCALPINPIDSLTMSNKTYKNTFLGIF